MTAPPMPDHDVPEEDESFLGKLRAMLLDTDGLDAIPEPEPLVDGVMHLDSLVWLGGKPGHGKSFVALDIAGCVGTGYSWHGNPVKQGQVLYIVAEGASGIRWRVRAWEKHVGLPMTGVKWLPAPVQAGDAVQWQALIDLAVELDPVLVVIDTQARVTVGMEENAAKDMGEFVDVLERLRRATRACVLVVHHQGRNGDHMRGSTALDGAAATIMLATKEDDLVTVSCSKQKDAEEFDTIDLALVPTGDSAVLKDLERGDPSSSVTGPAKKMAATWRELFGADPVSKTQLLAAKVASSEPTFYRLNAELVRTGVVEKVDGPGGHRLYKLSDVGLSDPHSQHSHPYKGGESDSGGADPTDSADSTENPQVNDPPESDSATDSDESLNTESGDYQSQNENGADQSVSGCKVCNTSVPSGHVYCSRSCVIEDRHKAWADW